MTVKAVEGEAKVLALGRDMLTKILGDQVTVIANKNHVKWTLQKSKLCLNLPQNFMEKLLEGVKFQVLKAGSRVIKQGDHYGLLNIIVEGNVRDAQNKTVAKKGDIVLESTLEEKCRGG